MIVDFLYNNPYWLVCGGVVGTIVAASILGLYIVCRMVPFEVRRSHNELAGFMVTLVSVFYAVLLAFIAVQVWETFDKARVVAMEEASLTGDVYRAAKSLPSPVREKVMHHVAEYVDVVLDSEWPAMQRGDIPGNAGWQPLWDLHADIIGFKSNDGVEVAAFSELLSRLNQLYGTRRTRLMAAADSLPDAVWVVVLAGLGINVAFTYMFGMRNFIMHALMTAGSAASIALVVVMIINFDYPFRGDVAVDPDAFRILRRNIEVVEGKAAPVVQAPSVAASHGP